MNFKIIINEIKDLVEEVFFPHARRAIIRSNRYYGNLKIMQIRAALHLAKIDLVVDVGANSGQFGMEMRRIGFEGLLLSFEPGVDAFQQLSRNAKDDKLWKVFNYALGAENKQAVFQIYHDSRLNSFLEGNNESSTRFKDKFNFGQEATIPIKRLDTVLPEIAVKKSDAIFLKLDTQGYDLEGYEVIGYLQGSVDYILIELSIIPIYKNMLSYIEVLKFFETEGYLPLAFFPVTRHSDNTIIEFDCLMKKKIM